MKKILILGVDGYLGWTLAVSLIADGNYKVYGVDNFSRRRQVENQIGSVSAIPIKNFKTRNELLAETYGDNVKFRKMDLTDYFQVQALFTEVMPDVIINLGQMPSAPYSMISGDKAAWTQTNNVIGNLNVLFAMQICPEAHLVKLGTMGEYGTPDLDIPEGEFELEFRGRKAKMMFPRDPGSWYHASKVHDTVNSRLACKLWDYKITDIMQGVVFGVTIPEMLKNPGLFTRFDFDEAFGTAINRFIAQAAIDYPLTVYGDGTQRRGFLPLADSIQCLKIAIENPPEKGKSYRAWNQFENIYSINQLAAMVEKVARTFKIQAAVQLMKNPRKEAENDHYYNPDHQTLFDLGYKPEKDIEGEIRKTLAVILSHDKRIRKYKDAIAPKTDWRRPNG